MNKYLPRLGVILLLQLLGLGLFVWLVTRPASLEAALPAKSKAPAVPQPHVILKVRPPIVTPGALVTLSISYYEMGSPPYPSFELSPTGVITFEPPSPGLCEWCPEVVFRALAPGVVTPSVSASTEIYDEICQCLYWVVAEVRRPATIIVADTIWSVFLPTVRR